VTIKQRMLRSVRVHTAVLKEAPAVIVFFITVLWVKFLVVFLMRLVRKHMTDQLKNLSRCSKSAVAGGEYVGFMIY